MSRVVHFDFPADDLERAKKFFENSFGWKFTDCPGMDYCLIKTGSEGEPGIDGGIAKRDPKEYFGNTISTENIDESIEKIKSNGGEILKDKCQMPGVGWLAHFKDSEGNAWGLIQEENKK